MAYFVSLLAAVIFCCSQVFVEGKWQCNQCNIKFDAIGCYKDRVNNRTLPEQILNERDEQSAVYGGRKIDWHNWDEYMAGFACRCAVIAKKKGYSVFAIQFYGECWSGPSDRANFAQLGTSTKCIGPEYKPCSKFDRNCAGTQEKNFVFRIVQDCDIPIESVGCFSDKHIAGSRPLNGYRLTDRDPSLSIYSGHSIDWRNWDVYMPEFVCRCAKKAKALNKATFSVQHYGECWVAEESDVVYGRDGVSNQCIDKCYEACQPHEKFCSGKHYANFVYRLADKPCEWKTEPVGCFKESTSSRALGTEILNEKDPTSKNFRGEIFAVSKWEAEFPKLLCRCAREAKKRGFVNFGVYDMATCWGSSDPEAYKTHGQSSECKKGESECPSGSNCAGGTESIFVYSVGVNAA